MIMYSFIFIFFSPSLSYEVNAAYDILFLYNNVRWLSKGRVLERFWVIMKDLEIFLPQQMNVKARHYLDFLRNNDHMELTPFLVDITSHLNELNLKLLGQRNSVCSGDLKEQYAPLKGSWGSFRVTSQGHISTFKLFSSRLMATTIITIFAFWRCLLKISGSALRASMYADKCCSAFHLHSWLRLLRSIQKQPRVSSNGQVCRLNSLTCRKWTETLLPFGLKWSQLKISPTNRK